MEVTCITWGVNFVKEIRPSLPTEKLIFMEKNKPIKRHVALQPLSREHHHGLLLSWKIRTGFSRSVPILRIKKYADWFFENYLLAHFEMEEKHIFPILGSDHPSVKRALREHRRLKRLFVSSNDLAKNLNLIEEELTAHIRFEERVLFNEVQQLATNEQMAGIEKQHNGQLISDDFEDRFWE